MGISAVLSYLKNTIDGQVLAGSQQVQVYTIPLPVLRSGLPEPLRLYIWPARVRVTQPTIGDNTRNENHQPISMVLRQTVNSVTGVEQFPALVDGLLSILMSVPPTLPLDAQGNVVTNASSSSWFTIAPYGGNVTAFDVQFKYPRLVLNQRPATLICEIGVMAFEQVKL